jgi:AraC-like DNA-binding protein
MSYPKFYLYKRIIQAKSFIDRKFQDNIDVSNIADEANYSKFHFIRLFKKAYGFTPRQYLILKRIEYAKRMLESNESVKSVCFNSGFSSVGTFSTLFKERIGNTPTDYAIKYAKRQASLRIRPEKYIPACHLINSNFQEQKEKQNPEI